MQNVLNRSSVHQIEELFGESLPKKDTPMVDGDHPEEDTSESLDDEGHGRFMMLIRMLNWIVCIGKRKMKTKLLLLLLYWRRHCLRSNSLHHASNNEFLQEDENDNSPCF